MSHTLCLAEHQTVVRVSAAVAVGNQSASFAGGESPGPAIQTREHDIKIAREPALFTRFCGGRALPAARPARAYGVGRACRRNDSYLGKYKIITSPATRQ